MNTPDRILIVDDNLTNRRILTTSLTRQGYETREAVDGDGALAIVQDWLPDLVLLDVSMPGRDGFQVCEALKAAEHTASVPVIFLTALSGAAEIAKAFEVGGSDYVTKPFHLGEVKARVSVHLGLRHARTELERAHVDLLQAQKLESIGQLAAGIAHEINTPTQYVNDNTQFLRDSFSDLVPILDRSRRLVADLGTGAAGAEPAAELESMLAEADVEYLVDEIPRAIQQSLEGLDRIAKIVRAMKDFSHPGSSEVESVDLNRAIESTVTVARSEWKYVADLETEFDPDLPPVPCHPAEVNQVILNMVVNAAHAIAGVVGEGDSGKGTITVGTRSVDGMAEIRITDTGTGIPADVRDRIFDPFFTTKEVGKGTGQGLCIAHGVVVQKHGGTIDVQSEVGRGTTFVIRLPLTPGTQNEAA